MKVYFITLVLNNDPHFLEYAEERCDYFDIFPDGTLAFFNQNATLINYLREDEWATLFDDWGNLLHMNDYWYSTR